MVKITGKYKGNIPIDQLKHLYEDSGWITYTCDMEKLQRALAKSLYVVTAWYDGVLIGLLRTVGDGETIIYIQDIVVMKSHRRHKIATEMVEKVINRYPNVRQKVLLADDTDGVRGFYEEVGFMSCDQGDLVAFVRFD